ncbi:MAG: hypothetical protein KIH63_004705 [Candidatus Saccharibacteria bacterium]|nr:hypothetical protein [Candidatus Saccharibacteria bacterium]
MSNSAFSSVGQKALGNIVQIVYVNGGGSSTNSSTAVDITGAIAVIAPHYTSSKIIVAATFYMSVPYAVANTVGYFQCLRGVTTIGGSPYSQITCANNTAGNGSQFVCNYNFVDAPGSQSATAYKFQHYSAFSRVTITSSNFDIVLMEIAS